MKISASIYAAKNKDLTALITELDALSLDYFHVDCFEEDVERVEKDIALIRNTSSTPIDLHVIGSNTDLFYTKAEAWGVHQLSFQYENISEPFVVPHNRTFKVGLALTNTTPLEAIEQYSADLDYVLLMTTTPGKSGGTFEKRSFERIRMCKNLYPHLPICVDGGINAEVSFILRLLGVNMAVSGSFLMNNINTAVALSDLRFHQKGSHYLIKDIMLPLKELPVLEYKKTTFIDALETIEKYKMGMVCFIDDGVLKGIASNADIRKGLLKNKTDLNNISIEDVINKTPKVILETVSTSDMLSFVKKSAVPLLFIPVVNKKNTLKGMVIFNELIKGEG